MPTTLFTWEPVVECFVAWDYLDCQQCYSADYQLVNTEAISARHKTMCSYGTLIKVYKAVLNYKSVMFF